MVKKISRNVMTDFFVCIHCNTEHKSDYHQGMGFDQGKVWASLCETRCKEKKKNLRTFTVLQGGRV